MRYYCKQYPILLFVFISYISCTNTKVEKENRSQSANIGQIDSPPPTQLDCNNLPIQFNTYDEAKSSISQASFQIQETVDTRKSSWIRGATYYSCDGRTGYFLLGTDKKEYLFQGMPLAVWEGFKKADSFGDYYNAFIRGRFPLSLGPS